MLHPTSICEGIGTHRTGYPKLEWMVREDSYVGFGSHALQLHPNSVVITFSFTVSSNTQEPRLCYMYNDTNIPQGNCVPLHCESL